MLEEKLREIMEDYKIHMILFVHSDLGTVQLKKDETWYIHGRKYQQEEEKKEDNNRILHTCPKCKHRIILTKGKKL